MLAKEDIAGGTLEVDVVGKEMTTVNLYGVIVPNSTETRSERTVFEEKRIIHEFNKSYVAKGEYCHPFSIYMPGFLPPSMHYENETGACSVVYTLTARFDAARHDRALTIVGKGLSSKIYPRMMHPTCFPLKCALGMVDHGFVILTAKVENTHVAKGRIFEVNLAVRNRSQEKIERINVHVVEEIEWRAKGNIKRHEVTVGCLHDVDLPGLKKAAEANVGETKAKPEVDGLTYSELMADVSSKKNQLRLKLPAQTLDTYRGHLINISHHLEVTVFTSGRSANPSITIPLTVFDPPTEAKTPHAASRKMVQDVATTVWPEDNKLCAPHHKRSETEGSMSSVEENSAAVD